LTIDLETKWTIGEFAYQDAGLVVLKDLSMGGNSNETGTPFSPANSMLDNIRMEIDVAGAGAAIGGDAWLKYGFSNVKNLAAVHVGAGNKDADMINMAAGSAALIGTPLYTGVSTDSNGDVVDDERIYGDGDLKIHFTFTDAWQKGGGFAAYGVGKGSDGAGGQTDLANLSFAAARGIATKAVDFEFNIGQIALADSGYATAGRLGSEVIQKTDHATGLDADSAGANTTTLISDLSIKGYLGPADIHIENNGNGFGADGSGLGGAPGTGNADSKIHWDSFFKVTDLDVYIDIAGLQITDLAIHNERGDTTSLNGTAAFGFAHSMRDIYAVKDSVLKIGSAAGLNGGQNQEHFVDGIAINTRFKGDIDIGALSFGDTGTSIGSIYITDKTATTNWTISAH